MGKQGNEELYNVKSPPNPKDRLGGTDYLSGETIQILAEDLTGAGGLEPDYTITIVANILRLFEDGVEISQVNLSPYLDNNNLARITSVVLNTTTGELKLIRDDASEIDIDLAHFNQQSDWNQTDDTKLDYIKNKPTIAGGQVQTDWNQTDSGEVDYIKNKPTIPTIPTITITPDTGSIINVSNLHGNLCNMASVSTLNSYTVQNGVAGAWARVLIDTTGKSVLPTVTGATLLEGHTFVINRLYDLFVEHDGNQYNYFFKRR